MVRREVVMNPLIAGLMFPLLFVLIFAGLPVQGNRVKPLQGYLHARH